MTTKTQKKRKSATNLQQNCNKSATELQQICYKSVPLLQKFREYLRKDVATLPQIWMPIETNLLIRYEFATLSPQTRYIFVAILLYCGARGIDEIPIDIGFLANALAVDARMLKKSLEELEFSGLIAERKKDREERIDRQTEGAGARVSVQSQNLSEIQSENQNGRTNGNVEPVESFKKNFSENENSEKPKRTSQFTIAECLKYVEQCQINGEKIQSPKALASHLQKTGEADSLILATLYPEKKEALDRKIFGEPRRFTDKPCSVCFGAKMADVDGKGFRACVNCKNERGKSTGLEPEGEN